MRQSSVRGTVTRRRAPGRTGARAGTTVSYEERGLRPDAPADPPAGAGLRVTGTGPPTRRGRKAGRAAQGPGAALDRPHPRRPDSGRRPAPDTCTTSTSTRTSARHRCPGRRRLKKPDPNAFGQSPLNILLLGSDGRNSKKNIELGGARQDADRKPLADVQMLLHVSADRSNMSVISIPRDTRVTIPECTDPKTRKVYPQTSAAINESLQHGGPGCTLATWQELTGIYVDHFMMVDFSGVVDMADAIGGVPVCVDRNVYSHDSKGHGSGLRMEKGTHPVKGVQALQWLRTRYGFEDNTDIGRAKAQHMYMNSMVRQLKKGTKLSNPGQLRDLAEAATRALTVDDGLDTVKKLYDLGGDLSRVPTKRITMVTMPWQYGPDESYVMPKPGDAEATFGLLRNDTALDGKDKKKKATPDPEPSTPKAQLKVVVQNGTNSTVNGPVSGRASVVQQRLSGLGYSAAGTDSALTTQADTTITYRDKGQRGDALALAKALGLPKSAVRESSSATGMRLVVGNDWRNGSAYPKESARRRPPTRPRTARMRSTARTPRPA